MTTSPNDPNPSAGSQSHPRPVVTTARLALGAIALVGLVFALLQWMAPGTLRRIEAWWLMVACLGASPLIASIGTRWSLAGVSATSILWGTAAQLVPKSPLWFHPIDLSAPTGLSALILSMIAAQFVIAAIIVLRAGILIKTWRFALSLGWARTLILLLVLGLSAATMMQGIQQKYLGYIVRQHLFASVFWGVNLVSIIAFAIALPGNELRHLADRVKRLFSMPGDHTPKSRSDARLPLYIAAFVLIACAVLSYFSFQNVPHVEDEVIYLMQAKMLAQGQLAVPAPPSPESFEFYLMDTHKGLWFATTFPGWAMVLAVGTWLNATWLVNPVLAAGGILLAHALFKSAFDRGSANIAILLMACSPWFLLMSSSLMLHTLTLALMLGTWLLLSKSKDSNRALFALAAGGLMGLFFLTRPMEGLLIGTLSGLWVVSFSWRERRLKLVAAYSLGCIIIGAGLFAFNAYLTGSPLETPLNAYVAEIWGEGRNGYGFRENVGPPNWGGVDLYPGHSPLEALIHLQNNAYFLNFEFLGWGIGSLFLAGVFVLWGRWTRYHLYLGAIVLMTLVLYSLYWFAGSFYIGPRYWFLMFLPLIMFSVGGLKTVTEKIHHALPDAAIAPRIGATAALLGVSALLVFTSWLAFNKYPNLRGYHGDYVEMSRMAEFENALIFVNSESDPEYGSAFIALDPTFASSKPIFALDLGFEKNADLIAAFPDRNIYFVEGRNRRADKISVSRGPLSSDDLILDPPPTLD